MDEILDEINQEEEITIVPVKKWQRILVFLADLLVNFMLAFLLFSVAVAPIFKAIYNFEDKNKQFTENSLNIANILFGNEILIKRTGYGDLELAYHIDYTSKCFLSYYVIDSEESTLPEFPEYGHKEKNNIFYHYYAEIRNDSEQYYQTFDELNTKHQYFEKSGDTYQLKQNVKDAIHPFFDPRDEMGKQGEQYMEDILEYFFQSGFTLVSKDIEEKDLTYNNLSFNECSEIIKNIESFYSTLLSTCAFISMLLSWGIYYLLVPLIHKRGKTLSMMLMRIERINVDRLYLTNKKEVVMISIYSFFTNFFMAFFLPMSLVSFNYLFSMPILLIVCLISLLLALTSFAFILANYLNRPVSDLLTRTVLIKDSELDKIYRAKGYKI